MTHAPQRPVPQPRLRILPGATHLVRMLPADWERSVRTARASGRVADGPLSVEPVWGPALAQTANPLAEIEMTCADEERHWRSTLTLGPSGMVIEDHEGESAQVTVGLAPVAALRSVMGALLPQRPAVIGAKEADGAAEQDGIAPEREAAVRSAGGRAAGGTERPDPRPPEPLAAGGPVRAEVHVRVTTIGPDGAPVTRARSWSAAGALPDGDGEVLGAALPLGEGAALVEARTGSVPQEVVTDTIAALKDETFQPGYPDPEVTRAFENLLAQLEE